MRTRDPRQAAGGRYAAMPKEQPYGASVITVNVDKPATNGAAIRRGYQREEMHVDSRRHQPSLAPSHSPSSNDEDDFNNYDYEMVDGRDHKALPRLEFGNGHHRNFPNPHHPLPSAQRSPKYENCYKQPTSAMDSDFDDEVTVEESRASMHPQHAKREHQARLNAVKASNAATEMPQGKGTKVTSKIGAVGGSFRTALSNHPLVKQQQRTQQQQHSVQSNAVPPPPPPPPPPGMSIGATSITVAKEVSRQLSMGQYDANAGYGRNAFVNSRREVFEDSNERYGRGCEQEPSESLDLPPPKSSSNGPKTIQIFADKSPAPVMTEAAKAWEPLKQPGGQRINDSGNASKVRSVVDKLNKDPFSKGGKDSMRSVASVMKQSVTLQTENVVFKAAKVSTQKPLPPATLQIPPPPPLPPTNGGYNKQNPSKPTLTSLTTDDVSFTDSLPPPPKQLQKQPKPEVKNNDDPILDEADLLLAYFKSNWQLVEYLQIKMPRDIIDRMNHLPRKVVFLKDASDLAKLRKTLRRPPTKRIRGARRTTMTRFNLHRKVLERVSSMREDQLNAMVSQQSTLQRRSASPSRRNVDVVDDDVTYAPHAQMRGQQNQDEQVYSRTGRNDSFGRRTPPPLMDSISESVHQSYQSQRESHEEAKWNVAYQNGKKNHRFVKKSAAGIITKRQSTSPTPLYASGKQPAPPPPGVPRQHQQEPSHRTESRIAAEIANLREREDELRRERAAMGHPVTTDEGVGHGGGNWKHDPRMIPLRETRSFNHLKINVENENQAARNWPPLQHSNGGHYGMAKSESFHQLHHQYGAGPPSHTQNNANNQKYLRRANPPSGSINSYDSVHAASCWIPADSKPYRWRSVAATLVSRRARSTTPRPMSVPPGMACSTTALSSPVFINTGIVPKGSNIYGTTSGSRPSANGTASSPYATLRMFAKYPLRAKLFSWPKRLRNQTPGRNSAMGL